MPAPASSDNDKAAGFSLMGTVVELLLVTLIAAGAGTLLAMLNPSTAAAPTAPDKAAASAEKTAGPGKEAGCAAATSNIIDLPPIVTNLGAPADTWIRVEASIVFDAKAVPHPEILGAEIATDELAYLRTVALPELQG